ncbi:MAG: hypothetical protein QM715_01450 [Nibricoccus sp.]
MPNVVKGINFLVMLFVANMLQTASFNCQASEISIYPIKVDRAPMFSWVKNGSLFYIYFGLGEGGVYLYRMKDDGVSMVVTNALDKINAMMGAELLTKSDSEDFLRKYSVSVFYSFYSLRGEGRVINDYYIKQWKEYIVLNGDGHNSEILNATSALLEKYDSEPKVAFKNDGWVLNYFVVLPDGSIENWLFSGCVFPFKMEPMRKEQVAKSGSVVVMPTDNQAGMNRTDR